MEFHIYFFNMLQILNHAIIKNKRGYKMEKVKLTNMCMIIDEKKNQVLVQDRIKDWNGFTFPGGKIKLGEAIVPATIREVQEETGLTVSNLKFCGIKDWYD